MQKTHVRLHDIVLYEQFWSPNDGLRPHKVTQYKKGKDSLFAQGKRRYDRKQSGYGGQTKPVFHKKVRLRLFHKIHRTLSPHLVIGQDYEESCAAVRMHSMQIQNATITETLQAVRNSFSSNPFHDAFLSSFELGGEKKTKGAALTFVSHLPLVFLLLTSNTYPTSKFTVHCFCVAFRRITNMICMRVSAASVHVPLYYW